MPSELSPAELAAYESLRTAALYTDVGRANAARAVVAAVRPHLAAGPPVHDGVHHYLSTGCLHGDQILPDGRTGHQYCQGDTGHAGSKVPAVCKFCRSKCKCPCHQDGGTP